MVNASSTVREKFFVSNLAMQRNTKEDQQKSWMKVFKCL